MAQKAWNNIFMQTNLVPIALLTDSRHIRLSNLLCRTGDKSYTHICMFFIVVVRTVHMYID